MKKSNVSFFLKLASLSSFVMLLTCAVSCSDTEEDGEKAPALFSFTENLAATIDTEVPIKIEVYDKTIENIQLYINDSLVKEWKAPKQNIDLKINTSELGIGAKTLTLKTTYSGGKTYTDERLMRVFSDLVPENWGITILGASPHNTDNFTQGLEFNNGILFEGTGQYGQSKIATIDLATGRDILKIGLDGTQFGEGITILGDTVYQITWQTGRCFTYNKNTLQPFQKEFSYPGEGWGLCNDGKSLIMSDGSERITFRNPKTFAIERVIEVYTNNQVVTQLNELEYIDGFIYANIWTTNTIVVIEPTSGKVIASMDAAHLARIGRGKLGEAFNGIAFNHQTKKLYLTGKRWEKIFEVEINKPVV